MAERFTSAYAQVGGLKGRPTERFTAVKAEVFGGSNTRRQDRLTLLTVNLLATLQPIDNPRHFDKLYVQVMSHWTPDFSWIENSEEQPNVFVYEEFPYDISFGSISATSFATDVVVVDSGDDQRIGRWAEPLQSYDISYGVRTMEQLQGLVAFFRAMRGRLYGFLYKDPIDFRSSQATVVESRIAPPTTANDQSLGTGDGLTYVFQMTKTYKTPGNNTAVRTITKPNADTVQVAINGSVYGFWTVDATTGLITFITPLTLASLPNLTLTTLSSDIVQIVGSGNCFSALASNMRIVMSGWANPQNNTTLAQLTTVLTTPNANTITVQLSGQTGENESNRAGVTIYEHPAPADDAVITCGYEFWVPVRFDTDKLPMTLNEYGVGDANAITLMEIRPGETV